MAVYDKISAADYNSLQSVVAGVLGTGSGPLGYGQKLNSSQVALGQPVTINEWANLRYDIANAYLHQNGSAASLAQANLGDTIRYNASTPITAYTPIVSGISSSAYTVATGQYKTVNKGTSTQTWPGPAGANWTNQITCTIQLSWSTADAARYFFNSGGEIQITTSRSGGSATPQNTSWTNLCNSAGTMRFGAILPSSGSISGTNFYATTSSYTQSMITSASSPYGANSLRLYALTPSVVLNNNGTSNVLFLRVDFDDYHASVYDPYTGTYSPDYVNGTFSVSVVTKEAVGTMQPPSLSTSFTVESPSVSIGAVG
jgi:hypothetical protein